MDFFRRLCMELFGGITRLILLQTTKNQAWTKLKAFAEDSFSVVQLGQVFSDLAESIMEKGENCWYWHFLLFPQCFQRASFP